MCAEYERQIASGLPITPTEKRPHNKIITNGSLPRSVVLNNPNFNMDASLPEPLTPEVKIQSFGRMDEIGSPYENVYYNRGNLKPKSPNSQSPRTRIKTTFAHKNLPSPQYFVFPTPPPVDNSKKPDFNIPNNANNNVTENNSSDSKGNEKFAGIEKQLSLEEDIPMIDDSNLTNDIEQRHSKIVTDKEETVQRQHSNASDNEVFETEQKTLTKNQSFDDVKKELMADIPELEEFEKDLEQSKREKMIRQIQDDMKEDRF
ncbi:hypothetical protein MSG28_015768 [Choristoneura fumiferana]|uniref:Uncharacterized protein n=1 Tax=Choristoneura fumiferana TaxID=7141 RepID=A0ACC0KC79_CHOFU|nr:hypothetical protein MSG28_015768 [Choristoneura fumiferana]